MQLIDVNKEPKKCEVTSLMKSTFLGFLGILRSCAYFRVSTAFLGSKLTKLFTLLLESGLSCDGPF